ncbi:hypothetical protein ACFWY5_14935 [Nonomuraea sp. NPDC059007]|uniref:hypothetical protein n=1 Tax=Nonomuraea sp. NPDC059007 TaxID=3346692 RepID=UPI0036B65F8A
MSLKRCRSLSCLTGSASTETGFSGRGWSSGLGQPRGQDAQPPSGDAQPLRRPGGVLPARQHRGQQVGAQPPPGVGAGPGAEHLHRDDLRGVGQRPLAGRAQLLAGHGPDGAEDLVAGPDRDGRAEDVLVVEVERLQALVDVAVGAEFVHQPPQPLGRLAAEDGLDAAGIGLVLAFGVGHHPRGAILDRDRRVHQRADRVGQGEQVVGHVVGRGRLSAGEHRAHQRRHLGPRRASVQAQQRRPGPRRCGTDLVVDRDRMFHHERHGPPRRQQVADPARAGHADPEQQPAGRDRLPVRRVVDEHAGDLGVQVAGRHRHVEDRTAQVLQDPPHVDRRPARHPLTIMDARSR